MKYNTKVVGQSSCTDVSNLLLSSSRELKIDQSPGTTDIQPGEPWAVLEMLTGEEMTREQQHPPPKSIPARAQLTGTRKWELTYKLPEAQGVDEYVFFGSLAGLSLFQVS